MDKVEMKPLDNTSVDIVSENKKKLMELFPEVFTEEGIILDKLKSVFGEYVEDKDEFYNFTWNGKDKAFRLSQAQSTGTLRPCKEKSKNWEDTQNLYIEGDNLEVLMLLRKSYYNKVKMIYIDPPYNTGKDFVYKDNYKDNLKNYLELTEQVDEEGNKYSTNSEQNGRYHTDWLNMMYPRLRIARDLLKDDGVIFISIDDNEVHNLRKVCDEIFGEDNFIATIIWEKKFSPQNDAKWLSANHDYVLLYAKNKEIWRPNLLPRTKEQNKRYKNPDDDPRGPWASSDLSVKTYSPEYDFPITTPSGKVIELPAGRCWMTSKDRIQELIEDNRIWFGKNGNNTPRLKRFLSEVKGGITPLTIWYRKDVGDTQTAKKQLLKVMPENVFQTPKVLELIERMLFISTQSKERDIVLDFFSGSATTAHATMKLNAEDGGNRKYIMVQLPEPTDEKSEAYKSGYKNICEIGKERIRRAGDKIIEENKDKEGIEDLDIGFKVFKLDSSNIRKWEADGEDLEDYLKTMVDNFVEGRTEEDILYEVMLKYGIDLTAPIESRNIEGKEVYSIGYGALFVCLDKEITLDIIKGIIDYKDELEPAKTSIIFRDNGFKDSSVKTNALQLLKTNDIDEVLSI
ncbi:site-specific DNA-methyltransferase [Dethiothermospora halolimnae]|uniref:site-specific DNA-methyltransferase n=1 Tax=Dethiothermospora halolimnae TaxID=3114390 RepID=UPI003CCBBF2F